MRELLDYLPVGMVVFQGMEPYEILYVNEAFEKISGYSRQEIMNADKENVSHIMLFGIKEIQIAAAEARKRGISGEYEFRMRSKQDVCKWYVLKIRYVEEKSDNPVFIMSTWDVDERKQMEEELYVQTERYKMVESFNGELPFDMDVESGEVLISRKYLTVRKMEDTLEHFAKKNELEEIIYGQDIEKFMRAMEKASSRELEAALEFRVNVSKEPEKTEYAWYRLVYKSIPGMNGKIIRIVGRMSNINQEKLKQYQMSEQIRRDSLTGLLNKAAAKESVEEYLKKTPEQCHAMMVIDIDNFKYINDNFGHLFGDTVLINIAEKISSVFRRNDIIARVGGDEFLVLMKGAGVSAATEKAERLCRDLRQEYQGEKQDVMLSCSVGISLYGHNGIDYETLFEKADYAMYQAKNAGKNQYKLAEDKSQLTGFRRHQCKEDSESILVQDESFLSAAFSLLAHTTEVNSSLNLLLERIGRRYNLDVVSVLEVREEKKEFVQTNCWKRSEGIIEDPVYKDKYENWALYMTGFNDRGIRFVEDYENPSAEHKKLRNGSRVRALVNCKFQCKDGKQGIVTYCNLREKRKWSDYEKEIFLEISKIIAVFVSLKSTQIENQNAILTLKRRDTLTGLLNEAAFRETAQEKISHMDRELQYAMIFTDIRDFSYVNENFGSEAGNQILKEFAAAVSNAPKVLSSRMYSDLFVSLVWDDSREVIQEVVESTIREFVERQHKKYPQGNLRLIAGIYFIDEEGEDVDIAIENANLARKKIKQTTNEAVSRIYTADLREKREVEKRIVAEFEDTLKEDRLKVFVQPKFLLRTMEIIGGEALVRWVRRDGTMEYPSDFIPVLEKSGHIVELDFYVFEQLLKYMQKWKREGKELYQISVNFSRKHFEGAGIYKRICELTEKYGIEHMYIEIEITESLLVSGLEMVRTEMELLRKNGFHVAIDDFGTGYSSLSMLRDIPADVVKIDRSFLSRGDMEQEREFIERIGALIRSVKEEVIFEGVETKQQVEFLVDCGFRYGQGFLYDRPLPITVFEEKYMK